MEHLVDFDFLSGFRFIEAYRKDVVFEETDEEGYVTVFRFVNDRHVEVDVTLYEGEVRISEPYAVDDDYEPI